MKKWQVGDDLTTNGHEFTRMTESGDFCRLEKRFNHGATVEVAFGISMLLLLRALRGQSLVFALLVRR